MNTLNNNCTDTTITVVGWSNSSQA